LAITSDLGRRMATLVQHISMGLQASLL